PGPFQLARDAGGIVFVNDTPDCPVVVVFSGVLTTLGCSNTRGFTADGQATFTPQPVAPGAAVSLCEHAEGTFPFEVEGLGPAPGSTRAPPRPRATSSSRARSASPCCCARGSPS